jgi:type IV pilus assembly protein PilO
MDLRNPKIQKFMLGGLAVFLLLYFWYARIYSKNVELIKQKQIQYEYLLTDLKSVEMKARSYESLKEEYGRLLERYQKVERLLPEEEQIPEFLMQMHSAARANQTGVIEIIPQAPLPQSFYNVKSFDMQMNGTYHDLGSFLSRVANFPFLANVENVTITGIPQQESASEQKGNSISASLTLITYFVKEEERLKRIEF